MARNSTGTQWWSKTQSNTYMVEHLGILLSGKGKTAIEGMLICFFGRLSATSLPALTRNAFVDIKRAQLSITHVEVNTVPPKTILFQSDVERTIAIPGCKDCKTEPQRFAISVAVNEIHFLIAYDQKKKLLLQYEEVVWGAL